MRVVVELMVMVFAVIVGNIVLDVLDVRVVVEVVETPLLVKGIVVVEEEVV